MIDEFSVTFALMLSIHTLKQTIRCDCFKGLIEHVLYYFSGKALFFAKLVDYAEALNLFPAHNNVQNMLLSISQLQEDRQYVSKFLVSNTDSNSEADFEYINNSKGMTKTMKNVFLSVISSITDPILSGIMTGLLFCRCSGLLF